MNYKINLEIQHENKNSLDKIKNYDAIFYYTCCLNKNKSLIK